MHSEPFLWTASGMGVSEAGIRIPIGRISSGHGNEASWSETIGVFGRLQQAIARFLIDKPRRPCVRELCRPWSEAILHTMQDLKRITRGLPIPGFLHFLPDRKEWSEVGRNLQPWSIRGRPAEYIKRLKEIACIPKLQIRRRRDRFPKPGMRQAETPKSRTDAR
jgi:hypothetical protein